MPHHPIYSHDLPARPPADLRAGYGLLQMLRHDPPGHWSEDRWEQSRHDVGVPYIAISAIMRAMAGCSVSVVKRKKARAKTTFGPGRHVVKALPTAHAHGSDERYAPAEDHPLAGAMGVCLERPNPHESIGDVIRYLVLQVKLTGLAPLWAVPSVGGPPCELYALPTALCIPRAGSSREYPEGAWYVNPFYGGGAAGWLPGVFGRYGTAGAVIPNGEISRWKMPHPYLMWDGYSPLTAGAKQLDILEAIDQSRWSAMEHGVTLDSVLTVPGLDGADAQRLSAQMEQRHGGSHNHRRFLVLTSPLGEVAKPTLQTFGQSTKDADYPASWDQMVKFTLALFGVPPGVAGLDAATSYAQLYAELKQFHVLTLRSDARDLGEFLTGALFRTVGKAGEFRVQIDLPRLDDDDLLQQRLGADTNRISVNEARGLRGLPPVEHGELPEQIYLKVVEAKAVPQPQQSAGGPQPGGPGAAPPGQPPGQPPGSPQAAGAADEQPQPDAGQPDDGQGGEHDPQAQDAAVQAALAALGVPDAVRKAHREGEKFQNRAGGWEVIRNGRAVPTKAPGGADPDEDTERPAGTPKTPVRQPAKPAAAPGALPDWYGEYHGLRSRADMGGKLSPKDAGRLQELEGKLQEHAGMPAAEPAAPAPEPVPASPPPSGDGARWAGIAAHLRKNAAAAKTPAERAGFELAARHAETLAAGGTAEPTPRDAGTPTTAGPGAALVPKPAPAPARREPLPTEPDYDRYRINPIVSPGQAVEHAASLLPEGADREHYKELVRAGESHQDARDAAIARGKVSHGPPHPRAVDAATKAVAPQLAKAAQTPAARQTLANAHMWADAHAAKHADRVARHFGISPEKAKALLADAIRRVAAHALGGGGAGATLRDPKTGKTLRIGLKKKAAGPPQGPPQEKNPHGKGSLPGRGIVKQALPVGWEPEPWDGPRDGDGGPVETPLFGDDEDGSDVVSAAPHSYGCAMLVIPDEVKAHLVQLAGLIPDDDLAEDGRELDSHVTLLHGI